ncbi:nuclear pore complex protein Nup93, partial [Tremellales sp. Uapishka_1]
MSTSTSLKQTTATKRPQAPTSLSSLLVQANSLNEIDHDPELPQIRFGIDEIERMSEVVAGKGRKGKGGIRGEGHTLLSNLGINTSHLSHSISSLQPQAQASSLSAPASRPSRRRRPPPASRLEPLGDLGPSYGLSDGDVGAWGRNWHEMVILSGIEVQRQRTIKSFQAQFQSRILQNWEDDKSRILQDELGVTDDELSRLAGGGSSSEGVLGKSRLGASTRRFPMAQGASKSEGREGGLVMHSKMMKYERVIYDLNQKRLKKEPFELCQALEATVKGDAKYPLLPTAYNILAHLTQEPSIRDSPEAYASTSTSNAEPVLERQYASAYLANAKEHSAVALKGRLVMGGRRFLERDFESHIDQTIAKHPKEAALGGMPGITNKVRAYVDVTLRSPEVQKTFRPETVGGIFLWAQVYYLLRCGYPSDALALLEEHHNHIGKDDWTFPGCFKSYLQSTERRLPRAQKDQLYNDFNSHIRSSTTVDQFKLALYKLVGRLELNRKIVKVATTTEDWTWVQLMLTRENRDGESPQEQYDLRDLGEMVRKFGSEKFDQEGTKPFNWFNLLILTGQFERAIAYLYSKSQLKTDAVHFAIALQYYGLLRIPANPDADLLVVELNGDAEVCALNFNRLIQLYIAPFHKVEPQTALQYAYLICLASDAPNGVGEKQKGACLEMVRDIVLASKSWSKLLGSVRADGSKEVGVIERDLKLLKLQDSQDYLRAVVLSAAEQSTMDTSLTDSIELYHLAGAYDKVVETVNRALGHSLGQASNTPLTSDSTNLGLSGAFGGAQDLMSLARTVYNVYEKDFGKRTRVEKSHWETLELLLQLKMALQQFKEDRPDLALETFKSTNLLPLDNDTTSISRRAIRFKEMLDQPVISNLDEVIVTTMKCLHVLSQQLKQSPYGDHGRMQQINAYKHQAQCLIQFASTLRLRLGPDVYRQLSSMSEYL